MRRGRGGSALSLVLLVGGCVPVVPIELIDARMACARARGGPAATLAPAALHNADEQLASAEQAFKDAPRSPNTRDLAYLAQRKAQLAEKLAGVPPEQGPPPPPDPIASP